MLRPPAGTRVLAASDLEPHAALQYGPRQWGVQFHPESDREIMQLYAVRGARCWSAKGAIPTR
ncbi:MAG: hypothetical protein R3E53_07995 [Myxococcota bacterium]